MRFNAPWGSLSLGIVALGAATAKKNLIVDTDLFSDCDDTSALLLAATSPDVSLLGVNVNYPSRYSALAASAILSYYGHPHVPIGLVGPATNETYLDTYTYTNGEYATKVAHHWQANDTLPWDDAGFNERVWDPVDLYRALLAGADNGSVVICSIGFLDNLSGLLNSTADAHSPLTGPELISAKVAELVVMGGGYPRGHEYNFFGRNASLAAHVVNGWTHSPVVFSGAELGGTVATGVPLMAAMADKDSDPTAAAYRWYTYGAARWSWDPLTMMYAIGGLGDGVFAYEGGGGYNHVFPNGSNVWVDADATVTTKNQRWLRLGVDNETVAAELDARLLDAALSAAGGLAGGRTTG